MKLICSQADLSSALALVGRAVAPERPSHPILANVLLRADDHFDTLGLTGYDLSLGIETEIPATVAEPGEITLPARLFSEIISKLPSDSPITLAIDGEQVQISSTSGTYRLSTLPASDYPDLPSGKPSSMATIAAGLLRHALGSTLYATATDESKRLLTGAHLATDADTLTIAATDGHRLAACDTELPEGAPQSPLSATIPARALREVERLLGRCDDDQDVCLSVIAGYARLQPVGGPVLITRTLDGTYPNYRQLVPGDFAGRITTNRAALISAITRVAVLADQTNGVVKLIPGDGELTIWAEVSDVGLASETLTAEITGDAPTIAFKGKYLLESLRAHSIDAVTLHCNSAITPVVIAGDPAVLALVMPVQVREG